MRTIEATITCLLGAVWAKARLACLAPLAIALVLCACAVSNKEREPGIITVSVEQHSAWVRNFNPLLPPKNQRWPTREGVYEPLLIFNRMRAEWTPWLASAWAWSSDLRTLRFTIRDGVQWSDGRPFTADDVVFTFELLERHPALDINHVWGFVEAVRAPEPHVVEIAFSRVYVPGLEDLAHQPIVPRHIWSKVADPVSFANPEPVGTGPFTEVRVFRSQMYEIGKNPRYWQPGKPAVQALRFLAYPTNEQAALALVEGTVDWAGNFLPAIERTFERRDPAHHHHWFPTVGSTIFLYANTARHPFDDVRVRKALSMGIDRKALVRVAMFDYTHPADATGLSDAFRSYRDPAVAEASWVHHDVKQANALLDEAGYHRGPDGLRSDALGRPLRYDINVVSGWSDWVRAAQLISRDLAQLGVETHVRVQEFGAWFSGLQRGEFELSIAWSMDGSTPYRFYRWLMSPQTVQPIGVASPGNWHRYGDARADAALARFETTTDPAEQQRLARELQRLFAELVPAIPLFPSPLWAEMNTRHVAGFPTPERPFAVASPNADAEPLLTMVALEPKRN